MNLWEHFSRADGVSRTVAAVLLVMSVASWVVMLWKSRLLWRAARSVPRTVAAFWQAGSVAQVQPQLVHLDEERLVLALVDALVKTDAPAGVASLGHGGGRAQQLLRRLREALRQSASRLQAGHIVLATVGSTAPFVGLLGTVWGIYHALIGLVGAGQLTLDHVAGPVGEALIMTAAGLAVAIPAVLAYNFLGRQASRIEAQLEGFAHDLHAIFSEPCSSVVGESHPDALRA
jgi:biopolymer transport protein ExbB